MAGHASPPGSAWSGDARWLAVFAAATLVELAWWAAAWGAGLAPVPLIGTYWCWSWRPSSAALALKGALADVSDPQGLARHSRRGGDGRGWSKPFLPLKYIIPREVPFWLDAPLASVERTLFGADPWLLLDRLLGWAAIPIDRIYGLWLPLRPWSCSA